MDGKKYKDKKKTVSAYRRKKGGKKSNKCVQDKSIASTTSGATDKSTPNAEGSKKTPISTCSTSVVIPCVEEPNKVYGIQYEPMAKKDFELKLGLEVLPAGLFIDKIIHFLVCSPDGLIGHEDLLEIKCPYKSKDLTILEGVKQKKIKFLLVNNSGELQLKKTDIYYYQVQGQLHVANKQNCYFVVWTPKDIFVEKIERDDDFWSAKMENKLIDFYKNYLLTEIVQPKIIT